MNLRDEGGKSVMREGVDNSGEEEMLNTIKKMKFRIFTWLDVIADEFLKKGWKNHG